MHCRAPSGSLRINFFGRKSTSYVDFPHDRKLLEPKDSFGFLYIPRRAIPGKHVVAGRRPEARQQHPAPKFWFIIPKVSVRSTIIECGFNMDSSRVVRNYGRGTLSKKMILILSDKD
jgi:hypothetical protein